MGGTKKTTEQSESLLNANDGVQANIKSDLIKKANALIETRNSHMAERSSLSCATNQMIDNYNNNIVSDPRELQRMAKTIEDNQDEIKRLSEKMDMLDSDIDDITEKVEGL